MSLSQCLGLCREEGLEEDSSIEYRDSEKRTCWRMSGRKEVEKRDAGIRVGIVKTLKVFRRQCSKTGAKKLINMWLVRAVVWMHKALGICRNTEIKD